MAENPVCPLWQESVSSHSVLVLALRLSFRGIRICLRLRVRAVISKVFCAGFEYTSSSTCIR